MLRTSSTRLSRQPTLYRGATQHHGDNDGDDASAEHAAGGGTVVVHEHSIFAYVSPAAVADTPWQSCYAAQGHPTGL